jgi:uncharacterized RDD family membrane protein YckC
LPPDYLPCQVSEDSFEIVCHGCRASVGSTEPVCPNCGETLYTFESRSRGPRAGAALTSALTTAAPWPVPGARAVPARVTTPSGMPLRPPPARRIPAFADEVPDRACAGFWIRVGAQLIDGLLVGALFLVVWVLVGGRNSPIYLVWLLLAWLYFPLMESSRKQGTIGKSVCGLAVTDTSGRRISFLRAVARMLAKILSGAVLDLGYVMIGFTRRKQGLHDLIAGTLVVRKFFVDR